MAPCQDRILTDTLQYGWRSEHVVGRRPLSHLSGPSAWACNIKDIFVATADWWSGKTDVPLETGDVLTMKDWSNHPVNVFDLSRSFFTPSQNWSTPGNTNCRLAGHE